jgi:L-fuculose-phosphate aldolase
MDSLNLEAKRVITGRDLEDAVKAGASAISVGAEALLTSTARDIIRSAGIEVRRGSTSAGRTVSQPPPAVKAFRGPVLSAERLFQSPQARAMKEEIAAAGHKLWQRNYVDGNGGNISFRLAENAVLCTPTLLSKGDLCADDICLVDLEGNQIAGKRKSTSEIRLHLSIYKNQPKAKACVHAHPPHATAYSIVGKVPPARIIPEAEVFIGQVALAEYDTPGSWEMANKVAPLCAEHNTILMANHGIVCWADSPTHAEWLVEIVENYCGTLMLAAQLGHPISRISGSQSEALLAIKKKMDLPDPRLSGRECTLGDLADHFSGITVDPHTGGCTDTEADFEALVREITDKIMLNLQA